MNRLPQATPMHSMRLDTGRLVGCPDLHVDDGSVQSVVIDLQTGKQYGGPIRDGRAWSSACRGRGTDTDLQKHRGGDHHRWSPPFGIPREIPPSMTPGIPGLRISGAVASSETPGSHGRIDAGWSQRSDVGLPARRRTACPCVEEG